MNNHNEIRIGIITENHFPRIGGMEFCNHFLARALQKLPDTTVAVSCSAMPEVPRGFPYPYKIYRSKSFSVLTPYLYNKNIQSMINKEKPDVLLGTMLHGGGATAVRIAKKCGLPVVVQSHGSDVQTVPEIGYGARLKPEMESLIKNVINKADRVLAVSSLNRNLILELGASAEKVDVLHNGISIKEINGIPFQDARPKYGLNSDDFVIITVSRNRPIKRMNLLFEALSIAKAESTIKCICVGPKEDLPEMVSAYGLEETVILTGPIPKPGTLIGITGPPFPELISLYRSADLFVSVSYIEAFQTGVTDSLACGIPVLVGKNHGVRDVIIEGQTGYVMEDETPKGLAQMLLQLSKQKQALMDKKDDIRRSVAHLTWDNTARRLREICVSLI